MSLQLEAAAKEAVLMAMVGLAFERWRTGDTVLGIIGARRTDDGTSVEVNTIDGKYLVNVTVEEVPR